MSRFRVGSIVCPIWDKHRRGKVTSYLTDVMVSVRWFPDNANDACIESWHETNLMHVSPKQSIHNMIKCKPIESEYPIAGGSWSFVVVNILNKEAVAAFVTHEDAEEYINSTFNHENYTIREVDNS